MAGHRVRISKEWDPDADVVLYQGDCRDLLKKIDKPVVRLAVTSPPYNVGKEYESRVKLDDYIEVHSAVIRESHRVLVDGGSLCWEVGNYIQNGDIVPLDVLLWKYFSDELKMKCRSRIVWAVPHGLHSKKRFSGRYEVILWFTKGDGYHFDLDPVRVPVKWPGKKYFKGPKKGQLSSNPNGKNPSDLWQDIDENLWTGISNVKHNHPEKTGHPCQFPEKLVRRLVLSLSKPGEWVLDPYLGSGTTAAVCVKEGRRVVAAEIEPKYVKIAKDRIRHAGREPKGPAMSDASPASVSISSVRQSASVQSR